MAAETPPSAWKFFIRRIGKNSAGIFFGNLVAGLFLDYLLEDGDKCDVSLYSDIFLTIGFSHYLMLILNALLTYAERVSTRYRPP